MASSSSAPKRAATGSTESTEKRAKGPCPHAQDVKGKVRLHITSVDAVYRLNFMECYVKVKALRAGLLVGRETLSLWLPSKDCSALDVDGVEHWQDLDHAYDDGGAVNAPTAGWPTDRPLSVALVTKKYVPGYAHTTVGKAHDEFAADINRRYSKYVAKVSSHAAPIPTPCASRCRRSAPVDPVVS